MSLHDKRIGDMLTGQAALHLEKRLDDILIQVRAVKATMDANLQALTHDAHVVHNWPEIEGEL